MIAKFASSSLPLILILALAVPGQAAVLVYDNLETPATAGYAELNTSSPVFGDSLNLVQGGKLAGIGLSLFNPSSSGGAIDAGLIVVNLYDNTVPYTSGVLSLPLLGTVTIPLDLTGDGGLPPGYYVTGEFDVSAANITVTQNIVITQQFTQTTGTATRNGVVLLGNPVVGSSPNTVYVTSATTPEGLYTFSNNAGQFAYSVTLVPEPGMIVLLSLSSLALLRRGKRS